MRPDRRLVKLRIETGMLVVETVAKIRRAHLSEGKGMKTIARELGLSRNTVRKVLRSGQTSFVYEREEQPRPRLGSFVQRLETLLEANASTTCSGARATTAPMTRLGATPASGCRRSVGSPRPARRSCR